MIKLPSRKIAIGKTGYEKKGFPFYEVYKDGIYIANFNGVITARKKMFGYEEDYSFPGVCEGKEEVKLEIPKVPFTLWKMIWSFYRDINEWQGTEATVLIYWDDEGNFFNIPKDLLEEYGNGLYREGDYILYAPKQTNYKALTEYNGDRMRQWLGENMSVIMDTHSHNSMSAFFSGTDDENEKNFQIYAVFGRVGTENEFVMRYRYMDDWHGLDLLDVFSKGEIGEGNIAKSTYPIGWIFQCYFYTGEELTC